MFFLWIIYVSKDFYHNKFKIGGFIMSNKEKQKNNKNNQNNNNNRNNNNNKNNERIDNNNCR